MKDGEIHDLLLSCGGCLGGHYFVFQFGFCKVVVGVVVFSVVILILDVVLDQWDVVVV